MGFLDSILGKQEPSEELHGHGKPFGISMKFIPMRLISMKEGKVDLEIKITNLTKEPQLVSVDALLPKKILVGFDPTCINKHIEKRLGEVKAGETKIVAITIWSSNQTKTGEYPIELTFHSHYLDYKKVLNYMKRSATVRVV